MAKLPFFLWLNSFPLCIYTISLSVHSLMDTKLFPYLGYSKYWCNEQEDAWILFFLRKKIDTIQMDEEIQPVYPKENKSWIFTGRTDAEAENSNTLATWCEELTHLKRPWCWERLKTGGEGVDRGWDFWKASMTQWTWIWGSSGSWWWTGNPGVLQSIGLQRVGHDWATELKWMKLADILRAHLIH